MTFPEVRFAKELGYKKINEVWKVEIHSKYRLFEMLLINIYFIIVTLIRYK